MFRPLLLAAALLAPAAALAQPETPTPSTDTASAPASASAPADAAGPGGRGGHPRMNMSPEMRRAREAMMQACSADFAKFCTDTGGGGRTQCIRAHRDELSDGCRTSMQAMRAARAPAAAPQG